jgi:hypothetical protein
MKLICTATTGSEAEKVLGARCKVFALDKLTKKQRNRVLKQYIQKYPDMKNSENLLLIAEFIKDNDSCGNPLYLKMLIVWSLACFPGVPKFVIPNAKEIPDLENLFLYSIRFFSTSCNHAVKKVLSCLSLCKNSMTKEEIAISAGVSLKVAGKILQIYDNFLIKHDDLYCFSNSFFRLGAIIENPQSLIKEISLTLSEHQTMKRMAEHLHFLSSSRNYKQLKDKLRDIYVFAYLYTNHYKFELCKQMH